MAAPSRLSMEKRASKLALDVWDAYEKFGPEPFTFTQWCGWRNPPTDPVVIEAQRATLDRLRSHFGGRVATFAEFHRGPRKLEASLRAWERFKARLLELGYPHDRIVGQVGFTDVSLRFHPACFRMAAKTLEAIEEAQRERAAARAADLAEAPNPNPTQQRLWPELDEDADDEQGADA